MPEDTLAPPPEVTPEVQADPIAPPTDLPVPPQPGPIDPENDPDHQLAVLISKRGERKAKKEAKEAQKEGDASKESKPGAPPEKGENITDLIAGALKFTSKEPKSPKPSAPPPKAEEPPAVEEPKPAPTKVTKQKPAPSSEETAQIAGHAAAAAATAAVQALGPQLRPPQPNVPDPGESLKAEDRKKYEVAKYLAAKNPHFKNAPKAILDQVDRADTYAQRWEAANPGKMFDPESDEHDEFYETLQEPWSASEFEEAREALREEALTAKVDQRYQAEIESIKETNARLELASDVDRRYSQTAGQLVKALNVHEVISNGGMEKLEQQDPIAAQALVNTLNQLQPLIETVVHIDDPKKRIKIDMNNPLHQQWAYLVTEGESRCVGRKDDQGRMFARRLDFMNMNPAQRARHWILTTDHIVYGIAEEMGKILSDQVTAEKNKLKKIAESLGYVPRGGDNGGANKSGGIKSASSENGSAGPPGPIKPQSPTVGGGAKIDTSGKPASGAKVPITHQIADILWKQ